MGARAPRVARGAMANLIHNLREAAKYGRHYKWWAGKVMPSIPCSDGRVMCLLSASQLDSPRNELLRVAGILPSIARLFLDLGGPGIVTSESPGSDPQKSIIGSDTALPSCAERTG